MGVGTAEAEAGSVLVLLLDDGLEVHHGVQLLGGVAQQALQVAHEPVHVPATQHGASYHGGYQMKVYYEVMMNVFTGLRSCEVNL